MTLKIKLLHITRSLVWMISMQLYPNHKWQLDKKIEIKHCQDVSETFIGYLKIVCIVCNWNAIDQSNFENKYLFACCICVKLVSIILDQCV